LVHQVNENKIFGLFFFRCTQLTDQAVLELGNQISDFMKEIEEFHLDVSGYGKIETD